MRAILAGFLSNMKRGRTDTELSLASDEFLWGSDGLTEAHRWILPSVSRSLGRIGAHRILDIGCGNGGFANAIAEKGREVVGIDSSWSGIDIARRSSRRLKFMQASVDVPLPSDLHQDFDTVVSIEVIEHLCRPRDLLRRAREALRPGGHLVVSTPYHGYLKNLALAITGKFDEHWHPLRDYGHVKFFSVDTLTRLFREEDFEVLDYALVGRVPWLARSMVIHGRRRMPG